MLTNEREIGALVIVDSHIVQWANRKDTNNDIAEFETSSCLE